jgi:thiol-disulfide isomerase/thioredoxin
VADPSEGLWNERPEKDRVIQYVHDLDSGRGGCSLNRQRIGLVAAGLLGLAVILPWTALQASGWLENAGVLVQVDGKPSGTSHIYDSDDFQRMLLVMDDRPTAAILDLAATAVYAIPRDSVRHLENGCVALGNAAGDYLATLHQDEGTLKFVWDELPISVAPIPPLIGRTDLKTILALKPSYATMADAYKPDTTKIVLLKSIGKETEVRVYFGTWCQTCKKLVPPLIATLRSASNPKFQVEYIGVDEDLTEPEEEIERYSVAKTPSVILLQDGKEIGRIEEETSHTIEADLVDILFTR